MNSPKTTALQARNDGQLRRSRVLIVGGGPTGQVYGYHLAQAGAEVAYYLKPRYAADAEEGFTLHPFGLVGRRPQRSFAGFDVITRSDELRKHNFDQVWLCISGPAMRGGVVPEIAAQIPDATWICLQPGLASRGYMLEHVEPEQLVMGMISLVAYQAPLPGEDIWPEGIAYWLPPMSPTLFSGPRAEQIANTLQRGGLGAAVKRDVEVPATFGSGALIPFIVALESARWSFGTMRRSDVAVKRLCGAIAEIFAAVQADMNAKPGPLAMLTKPWVWKVALATAPSLAPFPLTTYLKHHFSKLREQSEEVIAEFRALCVRHNVDAQNLTALEETWFENRPPLEAPASSNPKLVAVAAANDGPGLVSDSEITPVPGALERDSETQEVALVAQDSEVSEESEVSEVPEESEVSEGTTELAAQIAADVSDLVLDEPSAAAEEEEVDPEPPADEPKPALNLDKLRAKLKKTAAARATQEAEDAAAPAAATEE